MEIGWYLSAAADAFFWGGVLAARTTTRIEIFFLFFSWVFVCPNCLLRANFYSLMCVRVFVYRPFSFSGRARTHLAFLWWRRGSTNLSLRSRIYILQVCFSWRDPSGSEGRPICSNNLWVGFACAKVSVYTDWSITRSWIALPSFVTLVNVGQRLDRLIWLGICELLYILCSFLTDRVHFIGRFHRSFLCKLNANEFSTSQWGRENATKLF